MARDRLGALRGGLGALGPPHVAGVAWAAQEQPLSGAATVVGYSTMIDILPHAAKTPAYLSREVVGSGFNAQMSSEQGQFQY